MKGERKIVQHLNKVLTNELTAINQYFLHARMLRNWGLGKLMIGENAIETLKCDLALELKAIPELRKAIADCETAADYVSRELFERILEGEEEHVDWLETQLRLVAEVGEQNYRQSQI